MGGGYWLESCSPWNYELVSRAYSPHFWHYFELFAFCWIYLYEKCDGVAGELRKCSKSHRDMVDDFEEVVSSGSSPFPFLRALYNISARALLLNQVSGKFDIILYLRR